MKVRYLKDVTSPAAQQGEAGEVKDLDDRTARLLLSGGFVERVEAETETEENDNESGNTQRQDIEQ